MRSHGFTLLELMVVITVLAVLSALVLPLTGDTQDDAANSITGVNLALVRDAIKGSRDGKGFVQDTGRYPGQPANVSDPRTVTLEDLFVNDKLPAPLQTFNRDTRFGWHGPYLQPSTATTVDASSLSLSIIDGWSKQ